jgi:anti-sigma factor RsiW
VTCTEARTFVHGYVDGELDLVHEVQMEEHLRTCNACSMIYQAQLALRSTIRSHDLYYAAPADLERRVQRAARGTERTPWLSRVGARRWIGGAIAAAAVVVLVMSLGRPMLSRPTAQIEQDIVSAHVRSLMEGHLTDVPSSEQHTVKPWFAGRLDFSPPVVDLSGDGFALIGGRLDYAAGRPVAALVYRRGAHVINLFVWPSEPSSPASAPAIDMRQGYNVLRWTRGQTTFWAISDLNATELQQFARLVQDRATVSPTNASPQPRSK